MASNSDRSPQDALTRKPIRPPGGTHAPSPNSRHRVRLFRALAFKMVKRRREMSLLHRLWRHDEGQDIAEYAVMLAVILVLVVGTIRMVGSNANNVFSSAASSLQ